MASALPLRVYDDTAKIWDAKERKGTADPARPTLPGVLGVIFSPDGKRPRHCQWGPYGEGVGRRRVGRKLVTLRGPLETMFTV